MGCNRRLRHGCRFALFTGVVAAFRLCTALTVQPPGVECRETVRAVEEAGDPDMPDRVDNGPVRAFILTASPLAGARPLGPESRGHSTSSSAGRHPCRECTSVCRTVMGLLMAWSSVASWQSAF